MDKSFGSQSEANAVKFLESKGHSIVFKNFQFYGVGRGRKGEIDIISLYKSTLHITEVKSRKNTKLGHPLTQITPTKILTIKKTTQYFLLKNPEFLKHKVSFDVITILIDKLEYFPNSY
jgi:Holliday junction resolvase-like predicted endonuclease